MNNLLEEEFYADRARRNRMMAQVANAEIALKKIRNQLADMQPGCMFHDGLAEVVQIREGQLNRLRGNLKSNCYAL